MEKFNQGDQVLDKYDRPEDELETPEGAAINKRDRAFNAEGGFRNLLRLKIVIEDLVKENGFLGIRSKPDFIQEVIDDPKAHAYSALGFDILKKEISEEIAQSTKSEVVGIVGNIATFFRPHPQTEKRKIKIPKIIS